MKGFDVYPENRTTSFCKKISLFTCLTLVLFFSFSLKPDRTQASDFTINVSRIVTTNLPDLFVQLHVKDEGNRSFRGISSSDIKVYIDGQEMYNYTLNPVRKGDGGLRIVFIVQSSIDMKGEIFFRAKKAVRQIIERLAPEDQIALVCFSDNIVVLQDLTTEKVMINRKLHKTILGDNSISLLTAMRSAALYWEPDIISGSVFIVVTADTGYYSSTMYEKLRQQIQKLNIKLIGVHVSAVDRNRELKNLFTRLGGNFESYNESSDIWSIFKTLDTDSDQGYHLQIFKAHPIDFKTHHLKVIADIYGIKAESDCSYIGSPGEGINPKFTDNRPLSAGSSLYFFFLSITIFLAILTVFMIESKRTEKQLSVSVYFFAIFIGIVLGVLLALLVTAIP